MSVTRALRTLALGSLMALTPASARGERLLDQPPREVVFKLDAAGSSGLDLLLPFRDAANDRPGPVRMYASGPWGRWHEKPWQSLAWRPNVNAVEDISAEHAASGSFELVLDAALARHEALGLVRDRAWTSRYDFGVAPAFDTTGFSLSSDGFDSVFRLQPLVPVKDWRCRRKPVLVSRSGTESDRFELVRCDGSMAPEALDRLSILARPPEAARPGDLLPEEPDEGSWRGMREWSPGVRVLHPRLVWALQQLADAFPHKPMVLFSGYRPLAEVNDSSGHKSMHADGRALDLAVHKISNEELFRACTKLRGIGCGFYPHNKFIHIDVRRAGAGEAFFVDGSLPGEPAKYLDEYPGLVSGGKLVKPAP